MSLYQWALTYLAAGCVYLAVRWHFSVEASHRRAMQDVADLGGPAWIVTAAQVFVILVIALPLWPIFAVIAETRRAWRGVKKDKEKVDD